jgi:hypothetical protein
MTPAKTLTSNAPKPREDTFLQDLSKPSLHALSYALRHPDTWPEGFVWNYAQCAQCAMRLAHRLWRQIPRPENDTGTSVMARSFAMPYEEANKIFFLAHHVWGPFYRQMAAVTPEIVADKIDAYIKRAE